VFEGNGFVKEYDGGYDDWLRQKKHRDDITSAQQEATATPSHSAAADTTVATQLRKLSYKEKRELDELPDVIEKLEQRQAELQVVMADPEFYKSGGETISALQSDLQATTVELELCFQRWEELS
jgi:ATP-binding cassette subfamily F protein uup